MELLLITIIFVLVALLTRSVYISHQRLLENQELRRMLGEVRVDRLMGQGYSYSADYSGVTFIHQTPGRTDKLLVSIADVNTVVIDELPHSKLWLNYKDLIGREQELEATHPFEIVERIYDDIGNEYYRRDPLARVNQSSELRAIEPLAPRLKLSAFGEIKHWVLLNSCLPSERECIMVLKHGTPLKFQIRGNNPAALESWSGENLTSKDEC